MAESMVAEAAEIIAQDAFVEAAENEIGAGTAKEAGAEKDQEQENGGQKVSKWEYEQVLAELAAAQAALAELQERHTTLGKENESLAREAEAAAKEKNACEIGYKIGYEIERLLTAAGARNHQAVRGLLAVDELLSAGELTAGWQSSLQEQVNRLCEAPETAFLFAQAPGGMQGWIGLEPAAARGLEELEYAGAEGGFRLRLAQAKGEQDNLAAIRVKQEAAGRGVFL